MNELLKLAQMARRLGVTQKWLREQAALGELPSLQADRRFLFNAAAVEAALSEKASVSKKVATSGTK